MKHGKPGRPPANHKYWSTLLDDGTKIVAMRFYAPHRSAGTVYIGRASNAPAGGPQLKVRLKSHWLTDEHQNRWTSFSWIARNPAAVGDPTVTVDFLELVAIRLANPIDNGQMPKLDAMITWLRQVNQRDPDPIEVQERTFLLS